MVPRAASIQEIEMEGVIHYLFWATGVEFTSCPQDLAATANGDGKVLCGEADDGFDQFQILLDAAIIKMGKEEGPAVRPLSSWAGEGDRKTRRFGCCQGTFEVQFHQRRSLVLVSSHLVGATVIPVDPPFILTPAALLPATGEVLLQPGDILLGPADPGGGSGHYSITIVGPGQERQPARMTWVQSDAMNKAYRAGLGCTVSLQVAVAADGKVESATVVSSTVPDMGFEEAALLALGGWRLDPAQLGEAMDATPMEFQVIFPAPGATP